MKVQIAKIKITNRVRKEIAKIAELSEDIRINGLINPITIMSLDGEEHEYQLLAGLRRLRATEMLGHSDIAVNIVAPTDAEAKLRIEVSENEQREPFTFSEKMDFARMLEAIEGEKAKARMLSGKKVGNDDPTPELAEGQKGETREIVADKIGMGKSTYGYAKYIAENAPDEVIEELDQGQRSIHGTYKELRSKDKVAKLPLDDAHDDDLEDAITDEPEAVDEPNIETDLETSQSDSTRKSANKSKPATSYPADLLSKADEEAIERNRKFNAMSDAEKVVDLQHQLKEARKRAATAESELSRLKELRHNDVYHKDGIIANLSARLETAEARVEELEALINQCE